MAIVSTNYSEIYGVACGLYSEVRELAARLRQIQDELDEMPLIDSIPEKEKARRQELEARYKEKYRLREEVSEKLFGLLGKLQKARERLERGAVISRRKASDIRKKIDKVHVESARAEMERAAQTANDFADKLNEKARDVRNVHGEGQDAVTGKPEGYSDGIAALADAISKGSGSFFPGPAIAYNPAENTKPTVRDSMPPLIPTNPSPLPPVPFSPRIPGRDMLP